MTLAPVLEQIRGGLIVSCQAQETDPLYGSDMMARMALAAKEGGAVGIRANGAADIEAIKRATGLPVIGIVKRVYDGSDVYITPTLVEIAEVLRGGADIVAFEATNRARPDGLSVAEFIAEVKVRHRDLLLMADVSTLDEALAAEASGIDLVASTMSGYTAYSTPMKGPDFALLEQMVRKLRVPVVAEGRIQFPEQARKCLDIGTFAVVVGSAITRPQEITRTFVEEIAQLGVAYGQRGTAR